MLMYVACVKRSFSEFKVIKMNPMSPNRLNETASILIMDAIGRSLNYDPLFNDLGHAIARNIHASY